MSDDAKGMRCFVWDFAAGDANNKGVFKGGLFKQTTMTNAVDKTYTDVSTTKTHMPYSGSAAFAKTANWTEEYAFTKTVATYTNTTSATFVDGAKLAGGTVTTANAPLASTPAMTAAAWGTGFQWTFVMIYKPKADSDAWYTNGKLFSGALYTFSQSASNAYVGYKACESTATNCGTSFNFNQLVKPVLTTTANGKLWNAGAGTTTTLAGTSAFTSGTVTAATSTIDMFTVTTTALLAITVTQKATLGSAIATQDTTIQQLTCFPTYGTAPKQWLCFLGEAYMDASSATTTTVIKHQVWHSTLVPATASFNTATNMLDGAAVSLNLAAQKAFKVYEAKSAAVLPGEEASRTTITLPSAHFTWRNGNYLDVARTGIKTTIGFAGIPATGASTTADANLTITTIKTGVASAGFTATAAKAASTVMKSSAATAFTAPVAKTCDQSQSYCTTTYPTVCKTSGAASLAAAGAAILALTMAF